MGHNCCVKGCPSRTTNKELSFHRIPTVRNHQGYEIQQLSLTRRQQWIEKIGREMSDSQIDNAKLCSLHFIAGRPADLKDNNNPDWLPTVKMGEFVATKRKHTDSESSSNDSGEKPIQNGEKLIIKARNRSDGSTEFYFEHNNEIEAENNARRLAQEQNIFSQYSQALAASEIKIDQLHRELNKFRKKVEKYSDELSVLKKQNELMGLTRNSLEADGNKLIYYTGFQSYEELVENYSKVEEMLRNEDQLQIDPFQKFLIKIMKKKMDLDDQDMAFRFGLTLKEIQKVLNVAEVKEEGMPSMREIS